MGLRGRRRANCKINGWQRGAPLTEVNRSLNAKKGFEIALKAFFEVLLFCV